MNHDAIGSSRRFQLIVFTVALVAMFGAAYALPVPQAAGGSPATAVLQAVDSQAAEATEKRALTIDDYTSWRSISGQQISDDGKWVVYGLRFNNTPADEAKPVLFILNLESGDEVEVENATGGEFSKDSRWIAYNIDPSGRGGGRGGRGRGGEIGHAEHRGGGSTAMLEARQGAQGRARGDTEDEPCRTELRNLSTGVVRSWRDIQLFDFSADSTHLILRRWPPESEGGRRGRGGAGAGGDRCGGNNDDEPRGGNNDDEPRGGNNDDEPLGVDVVVHDLTTGRDQLLGSVGDISFNKEGDLLAYTVEATVKDSNGLFVLDLANARMNPLDNGAATYSRLTWNEEGTALAVLKGEAVDDMRERANVLIAFPDVGAALGTGAPGAAPVAPVVLDPSAADGFPEGWVVSERGALSWSKDTTRVFFGMKEQVADPSDDEEDEEEDDDDDVANVDIWNSADERIQSRQMRQADTDRNFTYRQAFDVAAGAFIKLADETMRDIDIATEGRWAVGRDRRGYIHDHNPAAADIYRVDTTTGERTLMFRNQLIGSHLFSISADGHYFLYWKDAEVQAYDLDAGTSRTLGGGSAPSFLNMEFDRASPRPAYGIAGYTEDGTAVIVQHRYDLWVLPFDGSDARNLTNGVGSDSDIRFRYVNTVPDDQPGGGGGRGGRGGGGRRKIDLSKPVTLSAYGQWTKKSGFYELDGEQLTEIVYEDAQFSTPTRAADAETFLFTRQTFLE
ncbi:MAG: hypothetical protein IH849_05780, partial [Acidobacteria bacterium]|nr:hypothetical protein [Acidobacteriota bacterium]